MSASKEPQRSMRMNGTILLRKLIAIERLIGKAEDDTLRNLLYDAEDYLIQMQTIQGESAPRENQARLELVG